jgi:phosphopantetheine--protein transferase-like protein
MLLGIGTDILKIDHIKSMVENQTDPFVTKTFTYKELELINARPLPLYSFATRFAGKEAVFKSLGIHGNSIRLSEIEILENEVGQPTVSLLDNAKKIAIEKGITDVLISLSYDTDYAIAYASAIKA